MEVMGEVSSADLEIHLLLTDVIMPDMKGRELYGLLLERHPFLDVLYMSGYTDDIIVHQGMLEDVVNFIHKPLHANPCSPRSVRYWIEYRAYRDTTEGSL